jgi:hypothetical protein
MELNKKLIILFFFCFISCEKKQRIYGESTGDITSEITSVISLIDSVKKKNPDYPQVNRDFIDSLFALSGSYGILTGGVDKNGEFLNPYFFEDGLNLEILKNSSLSLMIQKNIDSLKKAPKFEGQKNLIRLNQNFLIYINSQKGRQDIAKTFPLELSRKLNNFIILNILFDGRIKHKI